MPFINGIGPGEIIIILIIALIVVGPGKLPDVGSALGKSIREFRKAATDVKESTSLDAPATTRTAPAQVTAPAAPVVATPEASETVPAVAAAPLVPATPPVPPMPEATAATTPADGAWPTEVTPVDEHQPTASA